MERRRAKVRPKTQKILRSIHKSKIQLLEELSTYDRKKNEFYHTVEKLERFDLYTAYLLIKEFHLVLKRRRKVKNELRDIYNWRTTTIKKEMYRNHTY